MEAWAVLAESLVAVVKIILRQPRRFLSIARSGFTSRRCGTQVSVICRIIWIRSPPMNARLSIPTICSQPCLSLVPLVMLLEWTVRLATRARGRVLGSRTVQVPDHGDLSSGHHLSGPCPADRLLCCRPTRYLAVRPGFLCFAFRPGFLCPWSCRGSAGTSRAPWQLPFRAGLVSWYDETVPAVRSSVLHRFLWEGGSHLPGTRLSAPGLWRRLGPASCG